MTVGTQELTSTKENKKMKRKTIDNMTEAGFKYVKKYYPDTNLEIYERPKGTIIYNPKTDEIVMQTGYTKLKEKKQK